MKFIAMLVMSVCLILGSVQAGEKGLLASFNCDQPIGQIPVDSDHPAQGKASLKIVASETSEIPLFVVENLDMDEPIAYRAKIRTKDVSGKAFLQMWVTLDGIRYSSKGLTAARTGTTGWQEVWTPFFLKKGQKPTRVELNLAIEGTGTVWIDDVRLTRGRPQSWGPILGSALGLLGAVAGILCGIFSIWVGRNQHRKLVVGFYSSMAILGIAGLISGILTLSAGVERGVWYPLLLGGAIFTLVFGPLRVVVRNQYLAAEQRLIDAKALEASS